MERNIDGITYHSEIDPWVFSEYVYETDKQYEEYVAKHGEPGDDEDGEPINIPMNRPRQYKSYHLNDLGDGRFQPYILYTDEDDWKNNTITVITKEELLKAVPDTWEEHCHSSACHREDIKAYMRNEA